MVPGESSMHPWPGWPGAPLHARINGKEPGKELPGLQPTRVCGGACVGAARARASTALTRGPWPREQVGASRPRPEPVPCCAGAAKGGGCHGWGGPSGCGATASARRHSRPSCGQWPGGGYRRHKPWWAPSCVLLVEAGQSVLARVYPFETAQAHKPCSWVRSSLVLTKAAGRKTAPWAVFSKPDNHCCITIVLALFKSGRYTLAGPCLHCNIQQSQH